MAEPAADRAANLNIQDRERSQQFLLYRSQGGIEGGLRQHNKPTKHPRPSVPLSSGSCAITAQCRMSLIFPQEMDYPALASHQT
jgi:hypothetical protein